MFANAGVTNSLGEPVHFILYGICGTPAMRSAWLIGGNKTNFAQTALIYFRKIAAASSFSELTMNAVLAVSNIIMVMI